MPTFADRVVLVAGAALTGMLFVVFWSPREPAASVEVRAGATVVGQYSLAETRTLEVSGPLGTTVLDIRDGGVRFKSSPCRNQVCVIGGWHHHRGRAAACLPNRISLSLRGGAESPIDAVSH